MFKTFREWMVFRETAQASIAGKGRTPYSIAVNVMLNKPSAFGGFGDNEEDDAEQLTPDTMDSDVWEEAKKAAIQAFVAKRVNNYKYNQIAAQKDPTQRIKNYMTADGVFSAEYVKDVQMLSGTYQGTNYNMQVEVILYTPDEWAKKIASMAR